MAKKLLPPETPDYHENLSKLRAWYKAVGYHEAAANVHFICAKRHPKDILAIIAGQKGLGLPGVNKQPHKLLVPVMA